jgi:hypothetical protein
VDTPIIYDPPPSFVPLTLKFEYGIASEEG